MHFKNRILIWYELLDMNAVEEEEEGVGTYSKQGREIQEQRIK